MERCWNCSGTALQGSPATDGAQILFPHRAFWAALSAIVLMVVIALSIMGHIDFRQPEPKAVRIIVPDETGTLVNQSVLVDKKNSIVTYTVTSAANHTSTVIFDSNHGLICYKPDNQDICFLRKMERTDFDNVRILLDESKKVDQFWLVGNETQRHTEFVGVLGGSRVDASILQEPLQTLCKRKLNSLDP